MYMLTTINRGHTQSPRLFDSLEEACAEARWYASNFDHSEAYVADVSRPDDDLFAVFGTEGGDD